MRVRLAIPEQIVGPAILEPLLEAATRANQALIQTGQSPTAMEMIQRGVRWKPEPPWGYESIDLGPTMLGRGWADCDDWAPLSAASDRATGRDPQAKAILVRTGPKMWHAIVRHQNGSLEDPSKWAGMPSKQGARAPITTPMHDGIAIGVRPYKGLWHSRVDLPWTGSNAAIAGYSVAHSADDALSKAILHALHFGRASGVASKKDLATLGAYGALCDGCDATEIGDLLPKLEVEKSELDLARLSDVIKVMRDPPVGVAGPVTRYDGPAGTAVVVRL